MSFDTQRVYNPLPYNIVDKNDSSNRQGVLPSFQYKKKRTIWLNTAFATSSVNNGGNTYYEFSFDLPPFQLYNQTTLSVISYTINENNSKPCVIKVKNLHYDASSTWNSDKEGYPTLFTTHTGATGMTFDSKISLTLVPQLVSNITIKITDSFTLRDNGFNISGAGAGHFIVCLLFEDDDLIPDNAVSQYK
jgi:hypothetical protein